MDAGDCAMNLHRCSPPDDWIKLSSHLSGPRTGWLTHK
jgi:hypothetical protein